MNFVHLDSSLGITMMGGNLELYQKFLSDFIRLNKIEISQLENLLHHEPESFKRKVHTIKGQAGTIGATRLQKLAQNLEDCLEKDALDDFSKEFYLLVEEVENGSLLVIPKTQICEEKKTVSIQAMDDFIDELEVALYDSKPHLANEIMKQILSFHLSNKDEKLLLEIQSLTNAYQLRSAYRMLQIRKSLNF